MMMKDYRLILDNGYVHEGDDEREPDHLIQAIEDADMDGLPDGWTWIAGLYVRPQKIAAVEIIPAVAT